jgi:hypothetical protein
MHAHTRLMEKNSASERTKMTKLLLLKIVLGTYLTSYFFPQFSHKSGECPKCFVTFSHLVRKRIFYFL